MSDWVVKHLGVDQPLHFSRFHPHHKLSHLPPTAVKILLQAQSIARLAGLRNAYVGNVPGLPDAETTFCPNCRMPLIERDVFRVTRMDLDAGKCKFCQTKVAGVWTA